MFVSVLLWVPVETRFSGSADKDWRGFHAGSDTDDRCVWRALERPDCRIDVRQRLITVLVAWLA